MTHKEESKEESKEYAKLVADPVEELIPLNSEVLTPESTAYHAVVSVRRKYDTLFPCSTAALSQWFSQKQSDPNLGYLAPYVQFKQHCLKRFPAICMLDVTPEFLNQIATHWWQDCIKPLDAEAGSNPHIIELSRAFVDLPTLQRLYMIHRNLDVEEAEKLLLQKPVGTWLLREMPNTIPFSSVFTISGRSLERVVHNRFIYIYGVGYYRWNYTTRPVRFVDMFAEQVPQAPQYVCLIDCLSAMFRLWAPANMLISADNMEA